MRLLMTLFAVLYFPTVFAIVLGLRGFFFCLVAEAIALAIITLASRRGKR